MTTETIMTTEDSIVHIFCYVDDVLKGTVKEARKTVAERSRDDWHLVGAQRWSFRSILPLTQARI